MHGIVLGDAMAIHENPARELEVGDPLGALANHCAICDKGADLRFVADVGGNVVAFCGLDHKTAYIRGLQAAERKAGPKSHIGKISASSEASWTQGPKKVLLIRANFPDDSAEPISDADAKTMMEGVNAFFVENSYKLTGLISTISTLVTLPQTKNYYKTNKDGDGTLLNDARAVAKAAWKGEL